MKKPSIQHKPNTKLKPSHSNYYYSHVNPTQTYYTSLSATGVPTVDETSLSTTTKNGKQPFLPRLAGATSFSNYSVNSEFNAPIKHKVKRSSLVLRFSSKFLFNDFRRPSRQKQSFLTIQSELIVRIKNEEHARGLRRALGVCMKKKFSVNFNFLSYLL